MSKESKRGGGAKERNGSTGIPEVEEIRRKISAAFDEDAATQRLVSSLRDLAVRNGIHPSDPAVANTAQSVRSYVAEVPEIVEQAMAAAEGAGVGPELRRMLLPCVRYFREPNDVIPDSLGILGLVDDAYVAHCLLQSASENLRARTGRPLFGWDLTAANQAIRGFIGEPGASLLDAMIRINQSDLGALVSQLLGSAGWLSALAAMPVQPVYRDPMYGNASVSEIVNARLGALGVV